jgi:diguanylate cyclase (GGDEF)-like protein
MPGPEKEYSRRFMYVLLALLASYWLLVLTHTLVPGDGLFQSRSLRIFILVLGVPLGFASLVSLQRVLQHWANQADWRDSLTGLLNRRAFLREGRNLLNSRRAAGSVGLILYDLDGLGQVNENCGDDAGDELICQAARQLRRVGGRHGQVFRIGGDEFGVLVDRKSGGGVTPIVRWEIPMPPLIEACGHNHPITSSCGYASCYENESFDSLLRRAAKRLRESKGRNRPQTRRPPYEDTAFGHVSTPEADALRSSLRLVSK